MKRIFFMVVLAGAFCSCADEKQTKPGPTSNSTTIPWNDPSLSPGQGAGQFGMLPQNRHRR